MERTFSLFLFFLMASVSAESIALDMGAADSSGVVSSEDGRMFSGGFISVVDARRIGIRGRVCSGADISINILLGVICYDGERNEISVVSVCPVAGTETELTRGCDPEDDILYVRDASRWIGGPSFVFFNDNGVRSGWSCSVGPVGSVRKGVDDWAIRLNGVSGFEFSSGTIVRQHRDGNTYIYPFIGRVQPDRGWIDITGEVERGSASVSSPSESRILRPGTHYIKISIASVPANRFNVNDLRLIIEK